MLTHSQHYGTSCRVVTDFTCLLGLCLCMPCQQKQMAQYFGKEYLTAPWHHWYVTAARKLPAFDANANNIEAFHRTIPDMVGVHLRASFSRVLMSTLPHMIAKASLELATSQWLLQPTSVPKGLAAVAIARIEHLKNICFSPFQDQHVMFVLSRHFFQLHPDTVITTTLVQQYLASLQGNFLDCSSKAEAQELAGMMHVVWKDARYKGKSNPGFRCDCKLFMHISLCSCCLVAAEYCKTVDVSALIAPIRTMRAAGKQRSKARRKRSRLPATPQTQHPGGRPRAAEPALARQAASPPAKQSTKTAYKRNAKRAKAAYIAQRRM